MLMALFAEELGILARIIKRNYVTKEVFDWMNTEEDEKCEAEIIYTLNKFDTLMLNFSNWQAL